MAESAASVAIRKSLTVGVPVETAFAVFTEQIGSWWPLETKSVGQEESVGLATAEEIPDHYESGWSEILSRYAHAAERS